MSNALERRRREQAVIAAAREAIEDLAYDPCIRDIGPLTDALTHLDALELGPTDRTKSRGVEVTSEMAAAFMHGAKAEELSGKILRTILTVDAGATVDWLVWYLDRPHQSVSARVNELRDNGWIEDSGYTRPTRSGLDAIVWKLTPKAQIELSYARRMQP